MLDQLRMDPFLKLYSPLSLKYDHINLGFAWDCFCNFQCLTHLKITQKIAFE